MILILGATGYVGQAFAGEARRRGLAFVPLTRQALDYTRFDLLFHYVRTAKPDFIINAAGSTERPDTNVCAGTRARTVQANTLLPQTVARVSYLTKTPWGHVSSGDIFSGAKIAQNGGFQIESDLNQPAIRQLFDAEPDRFRGFTESDKPNSTFRSPPCTFYSGTKALAEEALHWYDQSYVWRPGPVFDELNHPRNLLSRVHSDPEARNSLGSISHRGDFVRACLDLWERNAPFGTYNVVNPGVVTGQQLLAGIQRVFHHQRAMGSNGDQRQSPAVNIPPVHCILDTSKLHAIGVRIRSVHDALKASVENWHFAP